MKKKDQPYLPAFSLPYGINECGALLVDTAKKEKTEGGREERNRPRRAQTGLSTVGGSGEAARKPGTACGLISA